MPLLLAILMLFAPPGQRPTDIVRWTAAAPSKPVTAGGTAKIELTAAIEDGWKLYALTQPKGGPIALEIALDKKTPFVLTAKDITAPVPKVHNDPNFSVETQYYEREAVFTLPITVPKNASGKQQVPLDVTFQACGAEICLRPFTQRINVDLAVTR